MEAGAALGRSGRLVGQGAADVDDVESLGHGIGDAPTAVGGGQIQAVGNRPAPIGPGINAGQAILDSQQTADIARVAKLPLIDCLTQITTGHAHDVASGFICDVQAVL